MKPYRIFLFLAFAIIVAVYLFLEFIPQKADTIFVNANIRTMDAKTPSAQAMAVRGDRIVGIGTNDDVRRKFRSSSVVDLEKRTVFPGLIDAHAHLLSLGLARMTVDLLGARTEEEAASRAKEKIANSAPGQWIRGRGWDQNPWPGKKFPSHRSLDKFSKNNPIVFSRVDGHALWVNSRAMEMAGVTKDTKEPEGGKIIRDGRGYPTGVFVDNAKELITQVIPLLSESEAREAVSIASQECLGLGLTTVHDMGVDTFEIALYKKMIDTGELNLRIYAAIGGAGETWNEYKMSGPLVGYGRNHLTVRAMKLYVDGALGSRGAALIEPYSDDPTNRGLTVTSEKEFQSLTDEALAHGFQVCTHAIGDRGNHMALDAYEKAMRVFKHSDLRLRVEHAQVLSPEDIPRFRRLEVIPSMQPTHCTSDMYWAEARLGSKRVRGAYAWRSLRNTGVIIPGGSDFPVEQPNPILGIYAACTRQDLQGKPRNASDAAQQFQLSPDGIADSTDFEGGWYVKERMTRDEALSSFTTWAAFAGFEEAIKGSLSRGKLADFIILSQDIGRVPNGELPSTVVLETYVGGKRVYRKP
ncbi:MAG: amidohydrolase [Ignavibacteriales bacterium]|nr:amidohydrolase [Ignavibacteriales bacterium]